MRNVWLAVAFLAAWAAPAAPVAAQKDKGAESNKRGPTSATAAASREDGSSSSSKGLAAQPLASEVEAAALAFAEQNHAELVELLHYLKAKKPTAYEQAIGDLFRARERLAQQKEQNSERYEVELALWKVESRIELLAARLKMAGRDSPEGEALVEPLRKLLVERAALRERRTRDERQRLAERLEKLDRQLESSAANREQALERELHRLLGHAPATNKPPAASKPPAKNKAANKAANDAR